MRGEKSSDSLAEESRRAMLAVVQIHAYGFNHTAVGSILDPRFLEPMTWRGSGFLIRVNGREGYVLTNAHVVRNATSLQVMSLMTSEEMFPADIVSMVSTLGRVWGTGKGPVGRGMSWGLPTTTIVAKVTGQVGLGKSPLVRAFRGAGSMSDPDTTDQPGVAAGSRVCNR